MIASIDTYLRFAEKVNRLDLTQTQLAGPEELRAHDLEDPRDEGRRVNLVRAGARA